MTPQQLVIELDQLVSLPDVCVKVNRLIDAPNYSALTLGDLIAQDSDLSARLLRVVNSAFFGMQAPVETISRAITVIGTEELRNLVMATTAARIFTGIPSDLVDMAEYWRYSITTGVIDQFIVGDFINIGITGPFSGNGRYIHGVCRDPRPSGAVEITIENNQ